MKSIIIAFVLIAAVACDVSEIVQGDGWYKDESGYHYTQPQEKFDAPLESEPIVPVEEPQQVELSQEPQPLIENDVVEIVDEYLPPVDYLPPNNDVNNEYLPPKTEDAKKKRQIPVRRQVRKVYRRFVRRH